MEQVTDSSFLISIVIPVYRSETILPRLVERIHDEMIKENLSEQFEILLINDCSPDESWSVISTLATKHPFVRGVNLRRNTGQHNAIMAGLNLVRGEFVVMMDDDLQHPPSELGDMVRALQSGYDVCYTRYINRQHVMWKKWGSNFNDWVATRLLDKPKGLYLSSFKAIRRVIAQEITKYDGPYAYVDGLILDVTHSITVIDIPHQARDEGESNYTFSRLLSLWMKMATSFSVTPLRMATYLGFALAALSMIMIIFIVAQKIMNPELASGWTSLIATVLFIGGIQTLCIGMIGEYLGRTYLKLNGKPQFTIGALTWENNKSRQSNSE